MDTLGWQPFFPAAEGNVERCKLPQHDGAEAASRFACMLLTADDVCCTEHKIIIGLVRDIGLRHTCGHLRTICSALRAAGLFTAHPDFLIRQCPDSYILCGLILQSLHVFSLGNNLKEADLYSAFFNYTQGAQLEIDLREAIRELIPKSRDIGHFSNPEIPGLSSPNPGIFGIKLCHIGPKCFVFAAFGVRGWCSHIGQWPRLYSYSLCCLMLIHCDFRVCLVSDSRLNTMIWYEQANVNADCSEGLISKLLSSCVCVHTVLRISKVILIWPVIIYLHIKQHSTFTINTKKNHARMKKRAT